MAGDGARVLHTNHVLVEEPVWAYVRFEGSVDRLFQLEAAVRSRWSRKAVIVAAARLDRSPVWAQRPMEPRHTLVLRGVPSHRERNNTARTVEPEILDVGVQDLVLWRWVCVGRHRGRMKLNWLRGPPGRLKRVTVRQLSAALGPEAAETVVDRADASFPDLAALIPRTGFGARDLLRTSAYTVALHRALVERGVGSDEANELISDIVFASILPARTAVYRLSRLHSRDRLSRARWGSRVARRFYYSTPDWVMSDVAVEDGFGFDVTRCVVAEFYDSLGMSELCQRAICDQDTRSATHHGVVLDRSETLAGGGARCDFRYRSRSANGGPDLA